MKKKISQLAALSAAALAVFVAVALLYKSLAFDGLSMPLDRLQTAALPVIALILAIAAVARFVAPRLLKGAFEESGEPDMRVKYLDYAAWLLLALCLSALIASPLAGIADYIFYAAVFAELSALCALFPAIGISERLTVNCGTEMLIIAAPIVSLMLSFVPAVGIYGGVCSAVISVTMLREKKAPANKCRLSLVLSVLFTVLATAVTISFVYLLH